MMDKKQTLERIQSLGMLAVIRGPSPELTIKIVEALVRGGVTGIEITYSTPNAEEVVRTLSSQFAEKIVLGMGTLTHPAQAVTARAAGASFLVSPVCDRELVLAMASTGLAVMAGALTPTEVLSAHQAGSDVVKIFPGSLTGPGYIKALKGPFPHIAMMPTGGVSLNNLQDWFSAGVFAVGAGSELCPPDLARAGKFDQITEKASEFTRAVAKARASLS
jgi:2-dehydro-3-deoxyphosphogluconate aldolase / (4S)-4-hydroxy-2-oxoglutarate aldolase